MSSDKPASDPQEPEGTGAPDAAAEHTGSESTPNDDTVTGDDTSATDSGTSAETGSGDPDAAARADEPGTSDAADSTASVAAKSTDGAEPGAEDSDKADSDGTVSRSAAEGSSEAGSEETVALSKSAAEGSDEAGSEKETDASPEPAAKDSDSDGRQSRSLLSAPLLIGAGVLLVIALVAVGAFFFFANDRQSELDRRAAATKSACDFGNSFATYTGEQADEYVQRLKETATGDWKNLIADIGPDLKARFTDAKVDSKAVEVQCGFESGSDDEARVVLVIDQEFSIADAPQEQPPGRVKVAANVDMQKIDGTWMVAAFDAPMMQQ